MRTQKGYHARRKTATRFRCCGACTGQKNFFKNFFFLCIKNESWRIITAERKQIRFSSDRARFPLKVVYRLFTTLPHTHKLLLALRRLRDTHAWAHSFLNAAFRSALFRADCAPGEKCSALARPRAGAGEADCMRSGTNCPKTRKRLAQSGEPCSVQ